MGYIGKDLLSYATIQEREAADARHDQTELLREQNRLIREQQIKEERRRQIEEINSVINAAVKTAVGDFEDVASDIGIGDPYAYFSKLTDLYALSSEEDSYIYDFSLQQVLSQRIISLQMTLREIKIKLRAMKKSCILTQKPITMLQQLKLYLSRLQRHYSLKVFVFPLVVECISLVCFFWLKTKDLITVSVEVGLVIICLFCVFLFIALSFLPVLKKNDMNRINRYIAEYNKTIKEEICKKRNTKIKSFEEKRVNNFNYQFEYKLFSISEDFSKVNSYLEKNGLPRKLPDFRLHFNDYPYDFQSYMETQEKEEAIQAGTDIFLDL